MTVTSIALDMRAHSRKVLIWIGYMSPVHGWMDFKYTRLPTFFLLIFTPYTSYL